MEPARRTPSGFAKEATAGQSTWRNRRGGPRTIQWPSAANDGSRQPKDPRCSGCLTAAVGRRGYSLGLVGLRLGASNVVAAAEDRRIAERISAGRTGRVAENRRANSVAQNDRFGRRGGTGTAGLTGTARQRGHDLCQCNVRNPERLRNRHVSPAHTAGETRA